MMNPAKVAPLSLRSCPRARTAPATALWVMWREVEADAIEHGRAIARGWEELRRIDLAMPPEDRSGLFEPEPPPMPARRGLTSTQAPAPYFPHQDC